MNNQQMIQEIRGVIRSKLHNNGIPVSIDIMKRKQEYYYNLSLSRVLSALGKMGMFSYTPGHIEQYHVDGKWQTICLRKLLNESGEDAYLDEQSDGTIKVLHELLVRK